MGLRDKYAYAIQTAKGKFYGNAEEKDGKLFFNGTVASEDIKNEIWNDIKTIPDWRDDIVADITVTPAPAPAAEPHPRPIPSRRATRSARSRRRIWATRAPT